MIKCYPDYHSGVNRTLGLIERSLQESERRRKSCASTQKTVGNSLHLIDAIRHFYPSPVGRIVYPSMPADSKSPSLQ